MEPQRTQRNIRQDEQDFQDYRVHPVILSNSCIPLCALGALCGEFIFARGYWKAANMIIRNSKRVSVNARVAAAALCVAALVQVSSATLKACAVPTHRYLLERWERDYYRTYYFYRGEEDKADREVNSFLEDAGSSFGSRVNLTFRAAEVSRISGDAVAAELREIWNEHRSDELPFHLILSPVGTPLYSGRLDLPTAKAIIQSPVKTRIARELCSGKGGLLLLLAGSDEKENAKAEKDVRWVVTRARKEHGLDVGFLRFSRTDPQEKWLVHSLLQLVEEPPDKKQCIVFGVCGRGRVLTACIGEGITPRNIIECVGIMSGDCSCDLRFASPGMDLLTDWDWEGAIASLPPMTEGPLQSLLLGFDDSEEDSQGPSQGQLEPEPDSETRTSVGTPALTKWSVAFAIASIVVVGIGLMMIRKRKGF